MNKELAAAKRLEAFAWFDTPLVIRTPKSNTHMAKQLGVSMPTLLKWKKQLIEARKKGLVDLDYSSKQFLISKKREVDEALVQKALTGSSKDREIYYRLTGDYTEKQEIKHDITADQLISSILKARADTGSDQVRGGSALLPLELCLDPGQGEPQDD